MTEVHIVTPEEARGWPDAVAQGADATYAFLRRLADTVGTEPDRTRVAVVRALCNMAEDYAAEYRRAWPTDTETVPHACTRMLDRAGAVKNGADW